MHHKVRGRRIRARQRGDTAEQGVHWGSQQRTAGRLVRVVVAVIKGLVARILVIGIDARAVVVYERQHEIVPTVFIRPGDLAEEAVAEDE